MRGQFVEEMPVYSHSGSDSKVARARLAFEILTLDSPQRHAANRATDSDLSRCARAKRNPNVMGKSIGRAKRQNRQRDRSPSQSLNNIVNRPISSTGKHRVASVGDGAARVVGSFPAGAANGKLSSYAGRLNNADGMVQLRVALPPAAPRVGVEQNCGSAHFVGWL